MMKKLIIIIAAATTICCSNQQQQTDNEIYVINLTQCLKAEQQFLISDIADTIEYIIPETPRNIIISNIRQIVPFEEYLFLLSKGIVYKFHKDGRFVRQIGSIGQGPGEYSIAACFYIDEFKNEIIVGSASHLLFYSLEGNFLRNQRLQSSNFTLSDSLIWVANYPGFWAEFQAISFTASSDTTSYIRNEAFGKATVTGYYSVMSKLIAPFYRYNGSMYYKGFEDNDTVRQLDGHTAKPHVYIDMGRYKLPYEYMPGTQGWKQYGKNYLGIPVFFEDDNYFFFTAQNRYAGEVDYLAYDKKKKTGFIITDNKISGITDNILCGPPLKLRWSSEDYYITVSEGFDLMNDMEVGAYSPVPALQKQLSTITDDTNQLIILCHKKRNEQP